MEENKTATAPSTVQNEQSIDIKGILYLCLSRWYWFVIAIILAIGIATYYLHKQTPVYTRYCKVLVKSDEKGHSAFNTSEFSDMGLFTSGVKINNELLTINSIDVIRETVRQLHLDMNYTVDGRFHPILLYDKSLPVKVDLVGAFDNASLAFDMEVGKDKARLTSFIFNGEEVAGEATANLGDTVNTPIGQLCVMPTDYFQADQEYNIHVSHGAIERAARSYAAKLRVELSAKNSDVMTLSINDISKRRADDFLNMLVAVYNNNWLKDKNQIMVSTSLFIDDRLRLIEQELGNVDKDISSYKSENLLPDVNAVSNIYLSQNTATTNRILEINNQISITRYIRNMLVNETVKNQLLPANSGVNSATIEGQIGEYNSTMLRRNSLAANSSEENPLVIDLDNNLSAMRQAIISSIDNQLVTLNNQLASLQGTERQINQRLAANPSQARYLLSVERQQKVKESLYLYLLQKREENQLSQAFTAYNTRVIEEPNGPIIPTSPKRSMIYLIAPGVPG